MQLLVIRHGLAGQREDWERKGRSDALRPLTPGGRKRMRRVAAGLVRLVEKLDLLASSPLVRARQTAEIVKDAFGGPAIDEISALEPGEPPSAVAAWLAPRSAGASVIALVGHEPGLGALVSWWLAGRGTFIELRKGGACLLELDGAEAGSARLLWSLTPRQLRRIARKG